MHHQHAPPAPPSSQQQLAALLAGALPAAPLVDGSAAAPLPDELSRVSALSSLHRTILHPHSILLVHRSSSYLVQALLQLLSEKSYAIKQAAAVAFGALGAVTASSNGRPNIPLPGAPADRFLGWALPLLSDVNANSEAAEIALVGLHEFVTTGETSGTERYIPSVLRACQVLLEDEGTPMKLLRPLLGILTAIASHFTHTFQPHFADLVDLLLGWALMPDLSESDCYSITNSFLHFQNFWAGNLPFSLNLLSKFLGDMEVLAQDATPGMSNQVRRLFALVSCFVAVLRATISGILELGFSENAVHSLQNLLPRFLACLEMVGKKFKTFKWQNEACTCLLLFANLLRERFSKSYGLAADFLLKSLELDHSQNVSQKDTQTAFTMVTHLPIMTASQVQKLMKVNLELLSLQGSDLQPNVVSKLLQSKSFSCLRLHPSRLVTGVVAQTYLSLLRHDNAQVAQMAISCLLDELITLKNILSHIGKKHTVVYGERKQGVMETGYSQQDVRQLIKFDVTALSSSVHQQDRSSELTSAKSIRTFLLDKLDPFENPFQFYADVQFALVQSLHRLCSLGSPRLLSAGSDSTEKAAQHEERVPRPLVLDCLSCCGSVMAKAVDVGASFPVKMETLEWLGTLCNLVTSSPDTVVSGSQVQDSTGNVEGKFFLRRDLMFALLTAGSDKEPKIRAEVAKVLVLLFHASLINPHDLQDVAEVALEHLGDPDPVSQNAFRAALATVASASLWTLGWMGDPLNCHSSFFISRHRYWKQVFVLRQFSQHLRPQQLIFVLNYIAQRWQVLPSSWLQRLIHNFPGDTRASFRLGVKQSQEDLASIVVDMDFEHLERICASSTLASVWWAIQEAARHCIAVRLRTHLGGPTQTFGVLECMLLDIIQSLQEDSNSQRETGNVMVSPNVQLLPMRLVLEFVEALKKNIYNAYEGSVVLPTPPSASVPFFRANRKVCEEWFVRICEALMNASLALQCHAATFHHATLRLQDLRSAAASALREAPWSQIADSTSNRKLKAQQDVLRTLRIASLALCRAHEMEMIVGLESWAASTFGVLLSDDALSVQNITNAFGPLGWMNGLMLQAQGRYEKAAAFFSLLLQSDEALGALGADGVQFIIARTIESYVALADWDSLEAWLQELQGLRAKHAGKAYAGALTTAGHDMNAIHALACFDAGDMQGAWAHLDLTPQSSSELTPDPRQALQRSEQMLLQALLHLGGDTNEKIAKEVEKAKSMLEEALLVSGFDGLSLASPLVMQLHCIKTFESKCNIVGARETFHFSHVDLFNPFEQVDYVPLDEYHQDCSLWLKLLRVYKAIMPHCQARLSLQWNLVTLARKQQNFKISHHLLDELSNIDAFRDQFARDGFITFEYEHILLQYAEEKHQEAVNALWNLVQKFLLYPNISGESKQETVAKACLKLGTWLKRKTVPPVGSFFRQGAHNKDEGGVGNSIFIDEGGTWTGGGRTPSEIEEVVGAAVKTATLQCPSMSKAWFAYASWCYNQAKSSFSGSGLFQSPCLFPQTLNMEFPKNDSNFTESEVETIRSIILDAVTYHTDSWRDSGAQMKIGSYDVFVHRIINLMQTAAGAVRSEDSNGGPLSVMLTLQLQQELLESGHGMVQPQSVVFVNKLLEVWWILRKRRVSLYGHALQGFLKHLSLSSWENQGKTLAQKSQKNGLRLQRKDLVLSSSLYVLHILFDYGVELDEIFRREVSSVSPQPWQEITPQIFARLTSHPEPQVRRQLEGLLMMLAHLSPWAVVYSILVNMSTLNGSSCVELQRLLACLMKVHPKLVTDVQLLMTELGAITVLWEELWLSTLQDLHADVIRIIALLKEEAVRLAQDTPIGSSEKLSIPAPTYTAYMSPIIASLERTLTITSRTPETTHESWFQDQYGSQLKEAILVLKSPPSSIESLNNIWQPFDALVARLASQVKKSVIPLGDVAPQLAALTSSAVPIPGLEKQDCGTSSGIQQGDIQYSGIVTVGSFHKQVHVLATKTKPKKLTMVGSDGQSYKYLLKGHEDLRLDARIMQLLRAVNGMLSYNACTRGKSLYARHYSVTPISGRAGLIQWVDNLISMYTVFKAWQQRNQAVHFASSGTNATNHPMPPAVPRPSDMFYGKMLPALKERGLRKVLSRRDWPQEVKRKVLLELMKETPRHLLYKELWCSSDGFTSFSLKLLRFSRSVAVMSIVGYILGLGDRHLDNILMDFSTGDVVHIDYNVCFDKGLRLKIPEIVPFRLTQIIQAALGLTGIEGTFRCSCEKVLETLRQNKNVILMLLDVFAWDPLIEWTKGEGREDVVGLEEKRGTEVVIQPQFSSHVQESRAPLQASDDMLQSQEAKSQEVLVTDGLTNEHLSSGQSHAKESFEHLPELENNLCQSLEEDILSQGENESWISPPNSGFSSGSNKEAQNPLDSFWLESAERLSSSRMWESTIMSGGQEQKDSTDIMVDFSSLEVEDKKHKAPPGPLHSQEEASFLATSTGCEEDYTKAGLDTKDGSPKQDFVEAPAGSAGLADNSPNNMLTDSMGPSSGFMNLVEDIQTGSDVRHKHEFSFQIRHSLGSNDDAYDSRPGALGAITQQPSRKKSAYAVSVLKKVECKLDGLDNESRRHLTVSEQVDHLLRQAMSIDNLCNMYEGWTPWI